MDEFEIVFIFSKVFSHLFLYLPIPITLNPFEAKIIAVCSPMPEVTPVITHVLPLLFIIYNSPFIITSITVV